jgi:hypothetical protein
MDVKSAAKEIARASEKPLWNDFEDHTFGLRSAVQLRVSLGDRQQSLEFARLCTREFEALTYRLQQPGVDNRRAALDLRDTLKRIQGALRYR